MTEKPQPLRVVHIISGDRWAGAEVQAYTLLAELKSKVSLHAIVLNEGELSARLRNLSIAVTVIDEAKHSSLAIFNILTSKLREIQPVIVHTHRQKENILGSLANLLSVRARCLRTVHGGSEHTARGRQRIQVWLNNFCGRYLQQAIIAVSADLNTQLREIFPQKKIHTIVNGIDPQEVRKGLSTPRFRQQKPNGVHIGIVGRVEPVKRVDIFLSMAALLLKNHPQTPWYFHIFGDGSLLTQMRNQADTAGISDNVGFHGHRNDIRSCIAGLNAVVMPSDHEGLPMTALECLALGKPLVAHSVGGLPNLLKSSPLNTLVNNHTAEAYAQALASLADNDGIPSFPQEYLSSENARQIEALYAKLLTPHQGG